LELAKYRPVPVTTRIAALVEAANASRSIGKRYCGWPLLSFL
jgi:hypothetical protein